MDRSECCRCSQRKKERSPEEYKKLIHRLNRIEGQIRGIRSMVESGAYCPDILVQAAAVNAAVNAFNKELLAAHIRTCVAEDIRALRANAVRDLLIFADRFPFLYFCEEYDLHYRAAFHGCSGDTEPSLATLKYLIDKVNDEHIPVVYTIDLSSQKVAEAVSECTGARIERLWSMQTVSRADFDAGETYLTLMQRNYEALKGGLL